MEKINLFEDINLEVEGTLFAGAPTADLSQKACGDYVDTKLDEASE